MHNTIITLAAFGALVSGFTSLLILAQLFGWIKGLESEEVEFYSRVYSRWNLFPRKGVLCFFICLIILITQW